MPSLVLDDGTVITESIAICRYFEAVQPEPPLFGVGAKEIALVEMWNRRCEINFMANVAAVFRHLHPAMKELEVPQVPAYAEAMRPRAIWFLELLDGELAKREFIAGDRYTVADITALVRGRFHEAGAARRARRREQRETLARRGVGAAEREGVMASRYREMSSGDDQSVTSGGRSNRLLAGEAGGAIWMSEKTKSGSCRTR